SVQHLNHAPKATADSASVAEDGAVAVDVVANDTDSDGDSLAPTVVAGPSHGTVVAGPGATLTYAPAADFHGSDSFTYRACDPSRACSSIVTVTLTVTSVNDAPVAGTDAVTGDEDTPVTVDVLANDADADGDALTVVLVGAAP